MVDRNAFCVLPSDFSYWFSTWSVMVWLFLRGSYCKGFSWILCLMHRFDGPNRLQFFNLSDQLVFLCLNLYNLLGATHSNCCTLSGSCLILKWSVEFPKRSSLPPNVHLLMYTIHRDDDYKKGYSCSLQLSC